MKCATLRNPKNGAGVFIPVLPARGVSTEIKEYADQACDRFIEHLETGFIHLQNQDLEGRFS